MTTPEQALDRGEVSISGVDTGPVNAERENLTPTEQHAQFQRRTHLPADPEAEEPDNEDG